MEERSDDVKAVLDGLPDSVSNTESESLYPRDIKNNLDSTLNELEYASHLPPEQPEHPAKQDQDSIQQDQDSIQQELLQVQVEQHSMVQAPYPVLHGILKNSDIKMQSTSLKEGDCQTMEMAPEALGQDSLLAYDSSTVDAHEKSAMLKVFGTITATLTQDVLNRIPGAFDAKLLFLSHIPKNPNRSDLKINIAENNDVSLEGDIPTLSSIEHELNELFEFPKTKCDKSIECTLLKPVYSRHGRLVKPISRDSPVESKPVKMTGSSLRIRVKIDETKNKDQTNDEQCDKERIRDNQQGNDDNEDSNDENGDNPDKEDLDDSDMDVDYDPTKDDDDEGSKSEKENKKRKRRKRGSGFKSKFKKDYEKEMPYKFFCKICSYKTKREQHLLKHRLVHEQKNPKLYKCSQCDFTAIRQGHYKSHLVRHSEDVIKCKLCSYVTNLLSCMDRHVKKRHPVEHMKSMQKYQCEVENCTYSTSNKILLERHNSRHDSGVGVDEEGNIIPFECKECDYKTVRREHFLRHSKHVHSEDRPHLCDMCGRGFKRKDALQQHRFIHLNPEERHYPYNCKVCRKGFRAQAHLKEHMSIHSPLKAFLCEVCGAAFKTKSVQQKHINTIHKNPRAFPCGFCSKKFNRKFSLIRHLRTHDTPGMQKLNPELEIDRKSEMQNAELLESVETKFQQQDSQDNQQIQVIEVVPSDHDIYLQTGPGGNYEVQTLQTFQLGGQTYPIDPQQQTVQLGNQQVHVGEQQVHEGNQQVQMGSQQIVHLGTQQLGQLVQLGNIQVEDGSQVGNQKTVQIGSQENVQVGGEEDPVIQDDNQTVRQVPVTVEETDGQQQVASQAQYIPANEASTALLYLTNNYQQY